MTDCEAIEIAVARTGFVPYRTKLDPENPHYDPRLWPLVHSIAALPPWVADAPPPQPPLPPVLPEPAGAWRDRIRTCLYRDPPGTGCGCQSGKCWAGRGLNGLVGDRDCYECLTRTE